MSLEGRLEVTLRVSTMASASALLFAFLLLLLLCIFSGVSGAEREHYHAIRIASLLPTTVCSTPEDFQRRGLKITYRHGPCSPSTEKTSLGQILLNDQLRVNSLKPRLTKRFQVQQSSSKSPLLPAHSGTPLGTGDYIVTVGFGTPKRDLSLIFDTGSDLTWIQCTPCVGSCYDQKEPIFNPPDSSSYSNVTCNSPECTQLISATGNPTKCSSSTCVYGIMYGDQSYSVGFFAHETLTLTKSDVFPNILFGCGQKNRGLFGKTAGLLGLGRDGLSFVSQTVKKFGKVFSYCLPSPSSSAGYLTFGNSGHQSSAVRFTPLLTNPNAASFYFLDLMDIKVGDRPLNISPSVFAAGGTIIDSGTVITRLPPTAYAALRNAFREMMSEYPSVDGILILDTCYNFSGYDSIDVPKIVMQFRGGADMELDFSGIFLANGVSQVCLAFAGNSDAGDVGIIGNRQQQTIKVVYDVPNRRVGFASGGCT